MFLKHLKLVNFRNYDNLDINLDKNINIFFGKNAQGKTNVLESIYYLSLGKSFRTSTDNDLIKDKNSFFRIEGDINYLDSNETLSISYNGNRKKFNSSVDGDIKKSEYISKLNVILFSLDDISLIRGNPENMRKYINNQLSQLIPNYYKILSDYENLLKIRNDYLKKMKFSEKIDTSYLGIIEEYLIDRSKKLFKIRKKYLNNIEKEAKKIFNSIMPVENFEIIYDNTPFLSLYTDDEISKNMNNSFKNNLNEEIKYSSTLYGPHKDKISFYIDNKNIKTYGSQGQQKLAILSFKLAELSLFYRKNGEYPILLLDDIFSEFDEIRKEKILSYLNENIQTIITTTDLNNISGNILNYSNIFNIFDGNLENKR